jgi:hypothetical protein
MCNGAVLHQKGRARWIAEEEAPKEPRGTGLGPQRTRQRQQRRSELAQALQQLADGVAVTLADATTDRQRIGAALR